MISAKALKLVGDVVMKTQEVSYMLPGDAIVKPYDIAMAEKQKAVDALLNYIEQLEAD